MIDPRLLPALILVILAAFNIVGIVVLGSAVESLWLSPAAARRLRHGDLPLFAGNGARP